MGLLVNTLVADEMYPTFNRDNLTVPIQMILSEKNKFFEKKDDRKSFFFSEITDSENVVR